MGESVANAIREYIKEEGLKQYVIAKKAGIPKKQFNALLCGRKTFDVKYLAPICKALSVMPDKFIKVDIPKPLEHPAELKDTG